MISERTRELLLSVKDLIQDNNFEDAYVNMYMWMNGGATIEELRDVTLALYSAGVNPLKYMHFVPTAFLSDYDGHGEKYLIPENIKQIASFSFSNVSDIVLYINGDNLQTVYTTAFYNSKMKIICSQAVKEQIENGCTEIKDIEFEVV